MSAAFFVLAAAAAIAAVVAATAAYRRVHRHEIRRGRIESFSEIAPGVPLPNSFILHRSGFMRYIVQLDDPPEKVSADSYVPRNAGDAVELLYERDRYSFKGDAFLPAVILAGAAALAVLIAALLLHFEKS